MTSAQHLKFNSDNITQKAFKMFDLQIIDYYFVDHFKWHIEWSTGQLGILILLCFSLILPQSISDISYFVIYLLNDVYFLSKSLSDVLQSVASSRMTWSKQKWHKYTEGSVSVKVHSGKTSWISTKKRIQNHGLCIANFGDS